MYTAAAEAFSLVRAPGVPGLRWKLSCGWGSLRLPARAALTSSLSPWQRSTITVYPHPVKTRRNSVTRYPTVLPPARTKTCNNGRLRVPAYRSLCRRTFRSADECGSGEYLVGFVAFGSSTVRFPVLPPPN